MNHAATDISIEVVFALPGRCWRERFDVPAGTPAGQALARSGLDAVYRQNIGAPAAALSVFGRKVSRDYVLNAGDRLELLRPLVADPRERRRARARAD